MLPGNSYDPVQYVLALRMSNSVATRLASTSTRHLCYRVLISTVVYLCHLASGEALQFVLEE